MNCGAGRLHWSTETVVLVIAGAALGMGLFLAFVVCVLMYDGFFSLRAKRRNVSLDRGLSRPAITSHFASGRLGPCGLLQRPDGPNMRESD